MELDPHFVDPSRRQAQQLLQRSERHEHQTPVHRVKPRVKHPGYCVQVISRRTIRRRRQQDDFRSHFDSNRGGEFISHQDTFGRPSGQVAPLYHPSLQHGNLLFLIGDDAEEFRPS
jgi:hypothetical protein